MIEYRPFYPSISDKTEARPVANKEHKQYLERANASIITAYVLYHININYRALADGTYEVFPVGDNSFTTIVPVTHLGLAIVEAITCFMESPVFIEQQAMRLQCLVVR